MLKTISQSEFFGGQAPSPTPDKVRLCQWTPWRDLSCLLRLCELHQPTTFLELGCNAGATSLLLSQAFPGMITLGIDPGQLIAPADRSPMQRGEYQSPERIGSLARDRPNVAVRLCTINELPATDRFDAIFIDGDHRKAAILNDTEQALARLNHSGFICWHDCGNSVVPDVEATLADLPLEITWIENSWIAFYISP